MNPPSSAPAMPSSIVIMNPPGSFPGVSSFAMMPTTSPNTIHDRIPMSMPPWPHGSLCKVFTNRLEQLRRDDTFVDEKPAFAPEPAAVTGEAAVGSDDAMARHDQRDGVGAVGGAHRPDGRRLADPACQLGVRDCGTGGNAA